MDDFCITIGFQNLIPYNVIPTSPEHLDSFKERPFIIKPIIFIILLKLPIIRN